MFSVSFSEMQRQPKGYKKQIKRVRVVCTPPLSAFKIPLQILKPFVVTEQRLWQPWEWNLDLVTASCMVIFLTSCFPDTFQAFNFVIPFSLPLSFLMPNKITLDCLLSSLIELGLNITF